jgi:hypothetical protein
MAGLRWLTECEVQEENCHCCHCKSLFPEGFVAVLSSVMIADVISCSSSVGATAFFCGATGIYGVIVAIILTTKIKQPENTGTNLSGIWDFRSFYYT